MKATMANGDLVNLANCYVVVGGQKINLNALPDISDQKGAVYNDEPIIGRTQPFKTYSHSENRAINMEIYFYIVAQGDAQANINALRLIQSAVYPRNADGNGAPYKPPPTCALRCGSLLGDGDLCVILRNYSVKFPRDVAFDEDTYCPYMFTVNTTWETIYTSTNLPGAERIVQSGF